MALYKVWQGIQGIPVEVFEAGQQQPEEDKDEVEVTGTELLEMIESEVKSMIKAQFKKVIV